MLLTSANEMFAAPQPKVGILFRKDEAQAIRARLQPLLELPVVTGPAGIRTVADQSLKSWPEAKARITPRLPELLDILHEGNPREFVSDEARAAAKELTRFVHSTAALGFVYFLTGDNAYAKTASEIIEAAGRVPRWGWFNWDGVNVPQIHYGMSTRNVAIAVDLCWDGWNDSQRKNAVEILAEKGVEHYWRLVSLSPFMGLHHLRSKNQGNNALSAAVIASLVVGDTVPENRVWFDSLLQTYCWIIAHDIGRAGTNLESGLPGYWEVSMQNLYTAAACLANARGIDLRSHPAFAEATWYPVMKEATVPPHAHGRFDRPYPKNETGLSGTIQHKPIELPSPAYGSSWWYDYAVRFPDSPAAYFISKEFQNRIADAHQEGHSWILDLLWVRTMPKPDVFPKPTTLFKTTDREAMFRSGYGSPHTFLSFNGDLFLSARNEVLGCTGGLSWHFPWHQYAVTESALETEGQPFSPSMVITDSFDGRFVSAIHADSGPSNVKYYPRAGQAVSHRASRDRSREIFYIRSDDRDHVPDYFVFIDRVAHDGKKWHAFNWHLWSQPGNEGTYSRIDDRTVLARRPNASLLLVNLSHDRVTTEEQAIPSQPTVSYEFDHNARLLRMIAGASESPQPEPVALSASLWSGGTPVTLNEKPAVLFEDIIRPDAKRSRFHSPLRLQPGCRYRVSLATRKTDARIYENFAWTINLKLLDADGQMISDAATADSDRDPHPLRLTCPASNQADITEWRETTTHFTAPAGVAAVEAEFLPATYGHGTSLKKSSRVWLSDLTFTPLGIPLQTETDIVVTAAIPLENDGPKPQVKPARHGGTIEAEIAHPNGVTDRIAVEPEGRVTVVRNALAGKAAFGWKTTTLPLGEFRGDRPMHAEMRTGGKGLSGIVSAPVAMVLQLEQKEHRLDAGPFRYENGGFQRNDAAAALDRNSPSSQQRLKEGLAPLAELLIAERDKYVRQGWKNIALDAAVKASGERDKRFAARNLIDNQTWEFPIDGVVDYTLGTITTPGNGGYGRGPVPWDSNLSTWSLFVRPTYWLLPERQTGDVTLTLKQPTRLKLVRLLNTTNAGLNDFATVRCHVDLLDGDGRTIESTKLTLGKSWDRAFRASFAKPEFFKEYGEAFRGILEQGVVVPFGTGWHDVPIDEAALIHAVRIVVDGSWALGGGLNEVQIYAAPE